MTFKPDELDRLVHDIKAAGLCNAELDAAIAEAYRSATPDLSGLRALAERVRASTRVFSVEPFSVEPSGE